MQQLPQTLPQNGEQMTELQRQQRLLELHVYSLDLQAKIFEVRQQMQQQQMQRMEEELKELRQQRMDEQLKELRHRQSCGTNNNNDNDNNNSVTYDISRAKATLNAVGMRRWPHAHIWYVVEGHCENVGPFKATAFLPDNRCFNGDPQPNKKAAKNATAAQTLSVLFHELG